MQTQAALLESLLKSDHLYIGIPKESSFQENRVALTPDSVSLLVNNGHRVTVETKAGHSSNFRDLDYTEAGADIAYDIKKVFEANMILKIAPLTDKELELLKIGQTVFSTIHLPKLESAYLEKLMQKKVTAIAYEYIRDEANTFPIVRALSELAGSTAVLIAAEYLSTSSRGQGILLGGISGVPPTKVVILGAGVVGEYAAKTCLGLGADIRVYDNNTYKLMRLQNNVGHRVYTSIITPKQLARELSTADVAIGAIHSESGRTPVIVSQEMVANMKDGAVIVDVSIDQGGCFAT
ncbi:UNVERIFIED_CONTAM: hypothetical protein GTU68_055904, partial [Idotea baltica]|nr:hypothetical protein [Idotea baltica]